MDNEKQMLLVTVREVKNGDFTLNNLKFRNKEEWEYYKKNYIDEIDNILNIKYVSIDTDDENYGEPTLIYDKKKLKALTKDKNSCNDLHRFVAKTAIVSAMMILTASILLILLTYFKNL